MQTTDSPTISEEQYAKIQMVMVSQDHLDLDSDNDGIYGMVKAWMLEHEQRWSRQMLRMRYLQMQMAMEQLLARPCRSLSSDNDGVADLDIDSDNDGIYDDDNESGDGAMDSDGNGMLNSSDAGYIDIDNDDANGRIRDRYRESRHRQ